MVPVSVTWKCLLMLHSHNYTFKIILYRNPSRISLSGIDAALHSCPYDHTVFNTILHINKFPEWVVISFLLASTTYFMGQLFSLVPYTYCMSVFQVCLRLDEFRDIRLRSLVVWNDTGGHFLFHCKCHLNV